MKTELVNESGDVRWILTKAEVKCLIAHASKDTTRAALNAVSLKITAGRCEAAATDGHRVVIAAAFNEDRARV